MNAKTALMLEELTQFTRQCGVKASINLRNRSLYIRGTFIHSNGHKQRSEIPLLVRGEIDNLRIAKKRIQEFTLIYQEKKVLPDQFPWQSANTKTGELATFREATQKLETDFWEGKTKNSEAKRTWQRIQAELNKLEPILNQPINVNDLVVIAKTYTEPNSRARLEACKVYKRMGRIYFPDAELKELDKIRGKYQPKRRQRFDEKAVIEAIDRLHTDPKYGWLTAALFIYGTRPVETFSLNPRKNGTAEAINCPKATEKHEKYPLALGIEENNYDPAPLIKRWGIYKVKRDWTWGLDNDSYDAMKGKSSVEAWTKWWKRNSGVCFGLIDLRHYWGIRSIHQNLDDRKASKSLGHSTDVHYKIYNSTYAEIDAIKAAADLRK